MSRSDREILLKNQAVLVRRDTQGEDYGLDEIAAKVGELLETIHHDMFERAKRTEIPILM